MTFNLLPKLVFMVFWLANMWNVSSMAWCALVKLRVLWYCGGRVLCKSKLIAPLKGVAVGSTPTVRNENCPEKAPTERRELDVVGVLPFISPFSLAPFFLFSTKMHQRSGLVFLFVFAVAGLMAVGAQARVVDAQADSQVQALYDLYHSTGGPNWINNTGWASQNDDPCGRKAGTSPWCPPSSSSPSRRDSG